MTRRARSLRRAATYPPATTNGTAANTAATHRRWATGPRLPATQVPTASVTNTAKLDRAPATRMTHPANSFAAPRRRSCWKAQVADHAGPPGKDVDRAFPARVISTMVTNPTRTPPARSSQRCNRAKTTIDRTSAPIATRSQPTRRWDNMRPASEI